MEAVLLVYSIGNRESFAEMERYYQLVRQHARNDVALVLVGTHSDGERQVPTSEGRQFADQKGMVFVEVSALNGSGVQELITSVTEQLLRQPTHENIEMGPIADVPSNRSTTSAWAGVIEFLAVATLSFI